MKYALISDIHGNLPALKEVLKDAQKRGVDQYLFLGDYVEDLPWPNETVDIIKNMDSATVIRGNKEDYLCDIHKLNGRNVDQMAAMYWNYEELTSENLEYLMSLPDEANIFDNEGGEVRIAHVSPIFYRKPKIDIFYSSAYFDSMKNAPFTHEEFLRRIYKEVCGNSNILAELDELHCKVNAFGHSHLQWHFKHEGVLYINPGSCGIPLDFNSDAPYSVIEFAEGTWVAEEIRVPYDVAKTVDALKESSLYKRAETWSGVIAESLLCAEERISLFLGHVRNVSREYGRPFWPVDNDIWRQAAKTWPEIKSGLKL